MRNTTIRMAAQPATYRARRARLASQLQRPIVILAGHAPSRTYPANTYPFRAGSNYLYFGGPPLEHAALVITPGSNGDDGCTLLRIPPTPDDAVWMGEPPTTAEIAAAAGLAISRIVDPEGMRFWIQGQNAAGIVPYCPQAIVDARELKLAKPSDAELRAIIDMRLYKDAEELVAMRRAAEISIAGHRAALAAARPRATENDVEAALVAVFARRAARHSFSPIVTIHGEVLHGAAAMNPLQAGQLLLVDAGAEEFTGYAGDITRTYPVGGKWQGRQRELYEIVLRAEQAAIDACTAGRRYRDVHFTAAHTICAGLVDVGILKGDPDVLTERGAYTPFFAHGVGHLLGLDAHDLEDFGDLAGYAPGRERPARFGDKFLRLDRDLAAGMVVTIEPGLYLVPDIWRRADIVGPYADVVNRKAVDALLAENFGGIRIEDNVVIRADGPPEVLTAALPKKPDEIAALVGKPLG
jgi:Xaa-Pro aminopeptidase